VKRDIYDALDDDADSVGLEEEGISGLGGVDAAVDVALGGVEK